MGELRIELIHVPIPVKLLGDQLDARLERQRPKRVDQRAVEGRHIRALNPEGHADAGFRRLGRRF